ncbi:MAG: hypothetical protein QOJ29_3906 [Thermoleophilaceae bacterium]|nr:hypothetical protein [Thermoleophilaceae bacterium]
MAETMPCPWCGEPNEVHDHFSGSIESLETSSGFVRKVPRNRTKQEGTCTACGKPIRRVASEGEPWRRVFVDGDRVRAPHEKDAVSGQLYPATVKEMGTRSTDIADYDTVTVTYDQTDFSGEGETGTVLADSVEPLPAGS